MLDFAHTMTDPAKTQKIRLTDLTSKIDRLRAAGAERTVVETDDDGHTPAVVDYRLEEDGVTWLHRFDFNHGTHNVRQDMTKG